MDHACHWCSSRKITLTVFEFKNKIFDFSSQIQTLLPTLSEILYYHVHIYVFRQHGNTQDILAERIIFDDLTS
jgi:hypothetical protein